MSGQERRVWSGGAGYWSASGGQSDCTEGGVPPRPPGSDGNTSRLARGKRARGRAGPDMSMMSNEAVPAAPPRSPVVHGWLETFHAMTPEEQTAALTHLVGDLSASVAGRTVLQGLQTAVTSKIRADFLALLPEEMSYHILRYLNTNDLLVASAVSRQWRRLAENDRLWKPHCIAAIRLTTSLLNEYSEKVALEVYQEGLIKYADPTLFDRPHTSMKQLVSCRGRVKLPWEDPRCQVNPEVGKLLCHGDAVVTCLCIAGPNRVISCSDDKNLIVWQIQPPLQLHKLEGHTGGVWSCATDNGLAVSGATDHTLRVWDIEKGVQLRLLEGHTSTVRCVHMQGDVIVSGSRDRTVRAWNWRTGECTNIFEGHNDAVRCIDMCDGIIASGSYDHSVRLWRTDTPDSLHVLRGHEDKIYSIRMTSKWIASGSLDTTIRVWSIESGECMSVLRGHDSLTGTLHVRNDGVLVSGNADKTIRMWDVETGRCLRTLESHDGAVTDVQVTSNHIVSCSDDGRAKLWSRNGDFIRDLVDSSSFVPNNDGVIWRLQCTDNALVCALGSRQQAIEITSLIFVDFTPICSVRHPNDTEHINGDGAAPRGMVSEITPEAENGAGSAGRLDSLS